MSYYQGQLLTVNASSKAFLDVKCEHTHQGFYMRMWNEIFLTKICRATKVGSAGVELTLKKNQKCICMQQ